MHCQILIAILALAVVISNPARAKTIASNDNPSPVGTPISDSKRLENEAKAADRKAATAKANLKKFEQTGDKSNPKAFTYRQLEFKAEVARTEFYAAQARLEALKSLAASASAAATDSSKSTQSKKQKGKDINYDNEIAKAGEEAFRKGKIAIEATRNAQDAYADFRVSQAKEAAFQTKFTEEESGKARLSEKGALSPATQNALATPTPTQTEKSVEDAAVVEKPEPVAAPELPAQNAEAVVDANPQGDQNVSAAQTEAASPAEVEVASETAPQEPLDPAAKIAAAKEALRQALAEEAAARKAPELTNEDQQAMEQKALEQAIAEVEASVTEHQQKPKPKKTVRKVLYSGQLFTLVRDDPVDE